MVGKHFLPVCDLSFHFLNGIFWSTKVINFDKVPFSNFLLLWYMLSVSYLSSVCPIQGLLILLVFPSLEDARCFSQWIDEWTYVPNLHPCTLSGKWVSGLWVLSSSEMRVLVHITISSCQHLFWKPMEMWCQRTVMCEVLKGRNVEVRDYILPCVVKASHIAVTGSSWWVCVPCETRHLCRSDQCFPRGQGIGSSGYLPGSVGNLWTVLRLQYSDDVDGSLFNFLTFIKMCYLHSWLVHTYKVHFHLYLVLNHFD